MKVLAVEHTGGIEAFRGKWEWLSREPDIDLTVLAPETWIENYRLVETSTNATGYRILTGKVAWRGYENRGFFFSGLLGAIRRVRPDVLHLMEDPFSLFALQSATLARSVVPRVKILFYTFDNLLPGFRYSYRPRLAYAAINRYVHRLSDCGVAACGDAGKILQSRGFRKPIRYVPLGIDPERYRPDPAERASHPDFVIGFVGRLLPMKGLTVLATALDRLEGNWRCLVLGSGPERATFEEAARKGGWTDRLRVLDTVPHEEVPKILAGMDALVLPSLTTPRWKEQFGRVLVEAMASGVPVVGSSSGAIPEVVGDAGLIAPEGDAAALAGALDRLMHDADLRARLARSGRERALRFFTWEQVAKQYATIYRGLMAGNLKTEDRPDWAPAT